MDANHPRPAQPSEKTGFNHVPFPLSKDGNGREHLPHIPDHSGKDGWQHIADETGFVVFAHLLRDYHAAVRSFIPPSDTTWAFTDAPFAPHQIICHNDFGPWNAVWSGVCPTAILDRDLANPSDLLNDVAYALEYVAPFRPDETALRWHAFAHPPD